LINLAEVLIADASSFKIMSKNRHQ
jgi:hypothetical protein